MESAEEAFKSGVTQLSADFAAGLGGLLDASTRLYQLEGEGALAGLQVEAFVIEEALSQPWRMEFVAQGGLQKSFPSRIVTPANASKRGEAVVNPCAKPKSNTAPGEAL